MNSTTSLTNRPLPNRESGERVPGMGKVSLYSFTVEPFHVDFTGHLFLGVLGNHLLNAAGRHSHNRGWGIDQLNEVQYTWVLSRLSIELTEMPAQYEHVEVETWVESVMKLFTERNFLIRNTDDGRIYGYARSIWAMIDLSSRQPSNLLELKDGDILRYVIPADEKPCPIAKYRPSRPATEPAVRTIDTHYSDVDINGHINSIKYVEHVLDLFPRELFEGHRLQRFDIAYKAESYLGDTLTFISQPSDTTFADGLATTYDIAIRKNVGKPEHPEGEAIIQAKVLFC